jgi:hypothetical protein
VRGRSRGGEEPLYQKIEGDQIPFGWIEKDGVLLPRRAVSPSQGVSGSLDDSAELDPSESSSWGSIDENSDGLWASRADVPSIFGPDFNALLVESDGANDRLSQQLGTSNGEIFTTVAIFEGVSNSTGAKSRVRFKDATNNENASASVNWDDLSLSATSADEARIEVLADEGPNGGPVVKVVSSHAHIDGASLSVFVEPFQTSSAGDEVVMHYANYYEQAIPGLVHPYEGSPPSVPSESFAWEGFPDQRSFAFYGRYFARTVRQWDSTDGATPGGVILGFSGGPESGSSHLRLRYAPDEPDFDATQLRFQHNDSDGNWNSHGMSIGRSVLGVVEFALKFDVSGASMRIVARVDGGSVSGDGGSTGPIGDWEPPAGVALNTQIPGGGAGSFEEWVRAVAVDLSALDASVNGTDDEAWLNEMADVPIGPHLAGHPNG